MHLPMVRTMDRFLAMFLVIDLIALLLYELLTGKLARGDGSRTAIPTPRRVEGRATGAPDSRTVSAFSPRDRDATFLDRIGAMLVLTSREKEKLRQLARAGEPDHQMIALEILSRFPDQQEFLLEWLRDQDRRILELVQRHLESAGAPLPPRLERLLSDLGNMSPGPGIPTVPTAVSPPVPTNGRTPSPPTSLQDPSASSLETLPEAPPEPEEQVIPEFAAPHDLFVALQNLSAITDEQRLPRATFLIQVGLRSADPSLRGAAVMALVRFRQPTGTELVRTALSDHSEYVRGCAVSALCELEHEHAIPDMNLLLQQETSDEVLEVVLLNLGHLHSLATLEILDQNLPRLPETLIPAAQRLRRVLARTFSAAHPALPRLDPPKDE